MIRANYRSAPSVSVEGPSSYIRLAESVSFLNKGRLKEVLDQVPEGGLVIIDGARTTFIDSDIVEAIRDFEFLARARGITVELKRLPMTANYVVKRGAAAPAAKG